MCYGGSTGLDVAARNRDMDCSGVCHGSAVVDSCGYCTEGNTGLVRDFALDCAGECHGNATLNTQCSAQGVAVCGEVEFDCDDACFGFARVDGCGDCSGGGTGKPFNPMACVTITGVQPLWAPLAGHPRVQLAATGLVDSGGEMRCRFFFEQDGSQYFSPLTLKSLTAAECAAPPVAVAGNYALAITLDGENFVSFTARSFVYLGDTTHLAPVTGPVTQAYDPSAVSVDAVTPSTVVFGVTPTFLITGTGLGQLSSPQCLTMRRLVQTAWGAFEGQWLASSGPGCPTAQAVSADRASMVVTMAPPAPVTVGALRTRLARRALVAQVQHVGAVNGSTDAELVAVGMVFVVDMAQAINRFACDLLSAPEVNAAFELASAAELRIRLAAATAHNGTSVTCPVPETHVSQESVVVLHTSVGTQYLATGLVVVGYNRGPQLVRAAFTPTLAGLVLTFDVPVVPGDDCAGFLAEATKQLLGPEVTCRWSTDGYRVTLLLGSEATIMPGAWVTVRAAVNSTDRVLARPNEPYTLAATGQVRVSSLPSELPQPVARIQAPGVVSLCDGLFLDGSLSVRVGGRPLRTEWYVDTLDVSQDVGNLSALVRSLPDTQDTLTLTRDHLHVGEYIFGLIVTDFLGQRSALASVVVRVVANDTVVPEMQIYGAAEREFVANQAVTLEGALALTGCSASLELEDFELLWSVAPEVVTPGSRGTLELFLPANSLSLTTEYLVTLQATHALLAEPIAATVTLRAQSGTGGLEARIAGGDQGSGLRTIGQGTALVLDATVSVDQLATSEPWRFEWLCRRTDGRACVALGADGQPSGNLQLAFEGVVTVPANTLAEGTYEFTVVVSKGARLSQAATTVQVVDLSVPKIDITGVFAGENKRRAAFTLLSATGLTSGQALTVRAEVRSASALTHLVWSVVSGVGLEETTVPAGHALGAVQDVAEPVFFPLVVPAGQLTAVGVYRFRLTAGNLAGEAVADVTVEVAAPPAAGRVHVTPAVGRAHETDFRFRARGWIASATGAVLTYQVGYVDEAGAVQWLGPPSQSRTLERQLPQGDASRNYELTVVMGVWDEAGTRQDRTMVVRVQPAQRSIKSKEFLEGHFDGLRRLVRVKQHKRCLGQALGVMRQLRGERGNVPVQKYRENVTLLVHPVVTTQLALHRRNAQTVISLLHAMSWDTLLEQSAEERTALADMAAAVARARVNDLGSSTEARRQRRASDTTGTTGTVGLSAADALVLVDAFAPLIDLQRFDVTTRDVKAVFVTHVETILMLLCRTVTLGQAAVQVHGQLVDLTVVLTASNGATVSVGQGNETGLAQVLDPGFHDEYFSWDCAADPTVPACHGVCVALAKYADDYTGANLDEPAHRRRSHIVHHGLVNQQLGMALQPAGTAVAPRTLVPLVGDVSDTTFECRYYDEASLRWVAAGCSYAGLDTTVVPDGLRFDCRCTTLNVQTSRRRRRRRRAACRRRRSSGRSRGCRWNFSRTFTTGTRRGQPTGCWPLWWRRPTRWARRWSGWQTRRWWDTTTTRCSRRRRARPAWW